MGTNWSGSPVGVFNTSVLVTLGVAANQAVIAAPAAGLAIYVQTLEISNDTAGGTTVNFHPAGGGIFASVKAAAGTSSPQYTFPGGFKLPTATGLQVDVFTNGANIVVTYTIGPAL